MAHIEVHDTLPDHPKVSHLATRLGRDRLTVVAHLICLWTWAIRYRPGGDLTPTRGGAEGDQEEGEGRPEGDLRGSEEVATAARYKGDPSKFVKAIRACGLLDGWQLHDWLDYTKGYKKATRDRERIAEKRAATVARQSRDSRAEPNRTEPNRTEPNREEERAATVVHHETEKSSLPAPTGAWDIFLDRWNALPSPYPKLNPSAAHEGLRKTFAARMKNQSWATRYPLALTRAATAPAGCFLRGGDSWIMNATWFCEDGKKGCSVERILAGEMQQAPATRTGPTGPPRNKVLDQLASGEALARKFEEQARGNR